MNFQRLFDVALAGPIARTVGGGRHFLVTLKDGRTLTVEGVYEPKHEEVFSENGVEILRPWPRIQLRRAQLIAAGVTDPQRGLAGARVLIDDGPVFLEQIRDDGYAFVNAKTSSVAAETEQRPVPRIL